MRAASFSGSLTIRALTRAEVYARGSKRQLFVTTAPLDFYSAELGLSISVPTGFLTDFGSVPSFAKWLVDDDDPDLLYASLPHDILYARKGIIPEHQVKLTRYQADCVLREAMRTIGAPAFKTGLVFNAVRVGGGRNWKDG
jgi:uncharacterized protein DUF1353